MNMIPENVRGALVRYIVWGLKPGSGTRAILSNDLYLAAACCDTDTWSSIRPILSWLKNYAPSQCHGSPERVSLWREKDLSGYSELRDGLEIFSRLGCVTSKLAIEEMSSCDTQ